MDSKGVSSIRGLRRQLMLALAHTEQIVQYAQVAGVSRLYHHMITTERTILGTVTMLTTIALASAFILSVWTLVALERSYLSPHLTQEIPDEIPALESRR